jgi:lipopolysaccharide transport system ATP-binding protein
MNDIAISVEGLGKRYRIGHQRDPYGRLTESLWGALRAPIDLARRRPRETSEWIWALRDVSFELRQGDVVGVIGRNGAGKSTLLKVLSRITDPSAGSATLRGRVGTLLEVGTGFHQELTGRENVFMSGAVLGMRRAEINRKFDEIVEFAGIEKFLDTPVKRYSSGMQVRLGFAVAAHLETEILLVDEVLAVGDADFQKKCLGKMSEIGHAGRTIMFVSHSMPAVLRLCGRAVLLDHGGIVTAGATNEVVRSYLESDLGRTGERRWESGLDAPGDSVARLRSIRVAPTEGGSAEQIDIRDPIDIEVEYWSDAPGGHHPSVGLHFYNDDGVCLFASHDFNDLEARTRSRDRGVVRSTCRIPGNFLAEGRVVVTVSVATFNPLVNHAVERDAIAFQIVDRSQGDAVRGVYANEWPGVVRPMLEWNVDFLPPTSAEEAEAPSRALSAQLPS